MDAKVDAAAKSLAITLEDWATAEAVMRLLGERKEWKQLAEAHRKLLAQGPDAEREGQLIRGLCSIYRDQLDDDDAAIQLYERLVAREPLMVADCLELALLHERNRRIVEALEVLDVGLRRLPGAADLYRRRFDLCAAMGDVDGAWRSAAALFLMDKIESLTHANFYSDHELREPRTPLRDLTPEDFVALRHHDEEPALSEVLRIARVAIPKRPRRAILKARTAEDLYLIAYDGMCAFYPQYELVNEELDTLRTLAFAAMTMFLGDEHVPPEHAAKVKSTRTLLEHALDHEAKDQLAVAVRGLIDGNVRIDLAKWRHGARASCASFAALLTCDLNLLEEVLDREPAVREATAACFVSARFGKLRADLGLGITPPA